MNKSIFKIGAAGASAVLMSLAATFAQSSASPNELTVAGLLSFENARVQAEATYDTAAIERDVADDLILGHGNGEAVDKAQYVDSTKAKSHDIVSIELTDQTGVIYGNVGVTNGIMENDLKGNVKHVARYLAVYRYENGYWQMLRWQSTGIASAKH